MEVRFLQSIHDVEETAWNKLWATDYPFIQHQFLAALENSGATTLATGWQPYHLSLWQDKQLIAASYTHLHVPTIYPV